MQLNYELSADDMVKAQRLFLRRKRPLFFWGFPLYGVGLLLFGLFMGLTESAAAALPAMLGGLYIISVPTLIMPLAAKGVWNKTPTLHGPTSLTLSLDGFEIANPLSRAAMRGQAVQFVLQDAHSWMLFLGPGSYYLVPKRALTSPDDAAQFERTVERFVALNAPKVPIAAPN